jgi:hypothetical protein
VSVVNHALTASECGRVSAVAGQAQREMREWAASYPGLFTAKPFDPALFGTLALASAFSGPWLTAAQLRMANRVCLWCFGLDWLVDYVATSPEEVREIVRRCLAVADGAPADPGDDLTCFLADIREELAAASAFPALGSVWRDDLRRMLDAMARESEWKAGLSGGAETLPTFEEYLGNADNLGFSFVFDSHWIFTAESPPGDVAGVREASRAVQRVIRLLNDIGTYHRDLSWGDLNALMLGVTRGEVDRRLAALADRSRELIRPLEPEYPLLASYLERQMDFCAGFYQVADYWGTL